MVNRPGHSVEIECSREPEDQMRRAVLSTVGLIASFVVLGSSAAATPPRAEPLLVAGCGTALAKPGGGQWECTFADEFNGTSLNRSKWLPQTNFATGNKWTAAARSCHVDHPANVAVGQGNLKLTVRRSGAPVFCLGRRANYTSGMVSTYRMFSQQYGRFEARMKVQSANGPIGGLQEAFWMWPDDRYSSGRWPASGEIDVAELYSRFNAYVIPFLHYTWNDNGGPRLGLNTAHCAAARGTYNTYTLIWTSTTLTIQVNGNTCLVNTSGDPAFKKPYIMALSQNLGVDANRLRWNTPIPATLNVDYVRVWR
jgi:beta-glucanase (GH16 family)